MWLVIAGSFGAIFAAAVTAYLGRRAKSGRIATSEATDLWTTIRSELARVSTEATELRAQLVVSRQENEALRVVGVESRQRELDLKARLAACTRTEKALRAKLRRAGLEP